MDEIEESVRYIRSRVSLRLRTAIVLGSGLGGFGKKLVNRTVIDVTSIPHYPIPGVEGHAGELVFGRLPSKKSKGSPLLAFVGRSHFYESGDLDRMTYPIRLAHQLGIKNLILTNAAGGVNPNFSPGDLMAITGHVNLTFQNPRLPISNGVRSRTKSITVYDLQLLRVLREAAGQIRIPLKQGVYCGVTGPSYETAAEIEMVRRIGADAVGMSTVHEAMMASKLGMRVLGISLITNLATGLATEPASHDDVIRVAREARKKFEELLTSVLSLIDH